VKQSVLQESNERRQGEESITQLLREMRESVLKESQTRIAAEEALRESLQASFDKEKVERISETNSLRSLASNLQKELAPVKDEVPLLRGRISEVETYISTRLKETQRGFEQELQEQSAARQRLEARLNEVANALEKEAAARQGLADETDHVLKSIKSKMKHQLEAQAETSRHEREVIRQQLLERIQQESSAREALQASVHSALEEHRTALGDRLDMLETLIREFDQRLQEQLAAEMREQESNQLKLSEEMGRQLRDLRENFSDRLAEERQVRELQAQGLEDHVQNLEGFLQDIREIFLQRGRRLTSRRTSPDRSSVQGRESPRTHALSELGGSTLQSLRSTQGDRGDAKP